jgi:pyruvate formate lyase activating enzyme
MLAAARGMGIHTTIETNGYLGDKLSDAELGTIDHVLLGIKTWGNEKHKALTGRELDPTLMFADRLAKAQKPVWIRFVLVPGLTDDPADIAQIARFTAGLGNVERVDVLPFHQMGRYKWEKLGMRYKLDATKEPSVEACEQAVGLFRAEGLTAY